MSSFERIDPQHPLTRAAREVNAYADEHGIAATLEWLGIDASPEEVAYLAQQRAYRAVYALRGINLDSEDVVELDFSPQDIKLIEVLVPAYMDAFTIGWKGHEIKQGASTRPLFSDGSHRTEES